MKKGLLVALIGMVSVFIGQNATAAPGDTVVVYSKDTLHWSGYGPYFTEVDFPDNAQSYQRVWMKATLGCPSFGCSEWDYTTKFAIMNDNPNKKTLLPDFKVDGRIMESVRLSQKPVFHYVYKNGKKIDSARADSVEIRTYNKSPQEEINRFYDWQADQYVYDFDTNVYDTNGKINDSLYKSQYVVDSHLIQTNTTRNNTIDTIQGEAIEMGRAATPYSGNRQQGWTFPWYFDVTDYQNFMEGTKKIRAFYRGPRDGFTIRFKFIMIKGTPPRDPVSVKNIYKSPATGWYYGFDTSDINNDRLYPKQVKMPDQAKEAKVRVSIKGHGFGDANLNCAEFCRKWYKVMVNQDEVGQQKVWRDDCDMTPVYPQTGTWILSRSNWCPGTESYPYDHEITDKVTPGDSFKVRMKMQSHNFLEPIDGNFTDPRWVIDGQVITYGEKHFDHNVAVEQIIAPNKNPSHGRFNPACGNPIVVIENQGAKPLKSAKIKYGGKDSEKATYKWEGNLGFMEADTVALPPHGDYGALYKNKSRFEVAVSKPNGNTDEYQANNKTASQYESVPKYPNKFRLRFKTNDNPEENAYIIKRKWGKVFYERSDFEPNEVHYDTFNLPRGCYEFILKDKRTGPLGVGDGLSYFANNESNGTARLVRYGSRIPLPNGQINPNFGLQVRRSFTVGYELGQEERELRRELTVKPNPVENELNIDLKLSSRKTLQLSLYSPQGKLVKQQTAKQYKNEGIKMDVEALEKGFYLLEINTGDDHLTRRIIKQ